MRRNTSFGQGGEDAWFLDTLREKNIPWADSGFVYQAEKVSFILLPLMTRTRAQAVEAARCAAPARGKVAQIAAVTMQSLNIPCP